jgi:AcrR family transcriptional regulator
LPARTDHDARRRDIAEAVWSVLASGGFSALNLRAVAAEMGATTGLLTHYYPNKRALLVHALDLLHERTDERLAGEDPDPGLDALRERLHAVLPTDEVGRLFSRLWVGFWDVALADAELGSSEAMRYDRWRARLRPHVEAAIERGDLDGDVEIVIDALTSATHGLVVQALFDPQRFPPERQRAAVDLVLARLGP